MNKTSICIVIPINKESLNEFEIQSVKQCIKVLVDYTIYFVCPEDLDLSFYKEKFKEINSFVFFDKNYFKDLNGYNKLMLNDLFYKSFSSYEYMIIYQTDCFVFRDELVFWAEKNFDYIGGLWFEEFIKNPEEGANLWYPGNGGLSLRKIKTMIDLLSSKKPLKNWRQLISEKRNINSGYFFKDIKGILELLLNIFGYKNNSSYYAKLWEGNEDVFFSNMYLMYKLLKVPSVDESLFFSWDRRPDYLFNKYKQLPFACHAWFREDYPYAGNNSFWSKIIQK